MGHWYEESGAGCMRAVVLCLLLQKHLNEDFSNFISQGAKLRRHTAGNVQRHIQCAINLRVEF